MILQRNSHYICFMPKFILPILLFMSCYAFSQRDTLAIRPPGKYDNIDAYAKSIKFEKSLEKLANDLTVKYDSELDKVRSIFIWITDNIAYDYKFVNKKKKIKPPKYAKGHDRSEVYREWEDKLLMKVINSEKAICEGYARLFKRLCDNAGIQSSVVSGYTKHKPSQVGKMGRQDHAWNAILVDGHYYFLDATWASGYCKPDKKGKLGKFVKEHDDYYWLTPSDKFHRDHFPKDSVWQRNSGTTKEHYRDHAYIQTDKMEFIDIIEPQSGVLRLKIGDTVRFKIFYKLQLQILQVNTNIKEKPEYIDLIDEDTNEVETEEVERIIPFKQDGDRIEFEYIVENKNTRYIDVLFDYNRVMRFVVKVVTK